MTLQQFINGLHSARAAHPEARVEQLCIDEDDRYTTLRLRVPTTDGSVGRCYCPITFLAHAQLRREYGVGNVEDAGEALGLSAEDVKAIVDAADSNESTPLFSLVRRQLTRALCIPDEPEPKGLRR